MDNPGLLHLLKPPYLAGKLHFFKPTKPQNDPFIVGPPHSFNDRDASKVADRPGHRPGCTRQDGFDEHGATGPSHAFYWDWFGENNHRTPCFFF